MGVNKGPFSILRKNIRALLKQTRSIFGYPDPIVIIPYGGFANDQRIYLKGRILEQINIYDNSSGSKFKNLLNTYRRFETDEIPCATVEIEIEGQCFELETDDEGYFTLDTNWKPPSSDNQDTWIKAHIHLIDPESSNQTQITEIGEIFYSRREHEYGIISDIDDTILQSHVTSRFKWKMMYQTFLKNASQRKPMEGVVQLFNALYLGSDEQQANPIFYVSNSPWNLYDLLLKFLNLQEMPKGPVLLRDYGLKPAGHFSEHKIESIRHILTMFPQMPFVLLGDSGEKDTDYYLQIADEFPNRIKAIYIRKVKDNKNASRIGELISQRTDLAILLSDNSEEFIQHARGTGLIV